VVVVNQAGSAALAAAIAEAAVVVNQPPKLGKGGKGKGVVSKGSESEMTTLSSSRGRGNPVNTNIDDSDEEVVVVNQAGSAALAAATAAAIAEAAVVVNQPPKLGKGGKGKGGKGGKAVSKPLPSPNLRLSANETDL
jgi:hypothetical protein